jgi:uncharacterized Zn finger protein
MYNCSDEYHHCPQCNARTHHRVVRERVLAAVLWCQSCFQTHVEPEMPPQPSRSAVDDMAQPPGSASAPHSCRTASP